MENLEWGKPAPRSLILPILLSRGLPFPVRYLLFTVSTACCPSRLTWCTGGILSQGEGFGKLSTKTDGSHAVEAGVILGDFDRCPREVLAGQSPNVGALTGADFSQ